MDLQTSEILARTLLSIMLLAGMAAWLAKRGDRDAGSVASEPRGPSESATNVATNDLALPSDSLPAQGERREALSVPAKAPPRDPSVEPDWNALVMTRLSGKAGPSSEPERWFERYVLLGLWRKRMRDEPRG